MPDLTRDGDLYLLDLGDGENRFTPAWIAELRGLLDTVAAAPAPRALVTTATGKFWSNGLDLDWVGGHPDEVDGYVADVHALFAAVLTLPVPTVAAVQGHAFAAGAMLALAHDWRVMRADRGFFCLPEVDILIPFTPGMDALIRCKLTPSAAVGAMTTGRRYGGVDALAAGLVTAIAGETDVVPSAMDLVQPLAGKDPKTLGTIKARMFASVTTALADRQANKLGG
jgi:enoyl-CoA hydratase/carnithine racemase